VFYSEYWTFDKSLKPSIPEKQKLQLNPFNTEFFPNNISKLVHSSLETSPLQRPTG
jgi:hypothetical protein